MDECVKRRNVIENTVNINFRGTKEYRKRLRDEASARDIKVQPLLEEAVKLYWNVREEAEKRGISPETDTVTQLNLLLSRNAVPGPVNDFSTGVTKAKKGNKSTGLNVSIGTSIIPNEEASKLWEKVQEARAQGPGVAEVIDGLIRTITFLASGATRDATGSGEPGSGD